MSIDTLDPREKYANWKAPDTVVENSKPQQTKVEQAPLSEEKEQPFQPVIPRGWTTLKHGTNLIKWGDINPYTTESIKLERPLSVVSQEDYERDKQSGGRYDTTESYAGSAIKPKEMSDTEFAQKNIPFEIRVLFYKDHVRQNTDREYKQKLDQKTRDEISKYYFANIQGGRHPLVPRGETLIKLGQVQEGGKDVFYFIPESVENSYSQEAGIK